MTKREQIIAQLRAVGFKQRDYNSSRYVSLSRRNANVDVGPRGSTACWLVSITGNKAHSYRVSLADIMALPQ